MMPFPDLERATGGTQPLATHPVGHSVPTCHAHKRPPRRDNSDVLRGRRHVALTERGQIALKISRLAVDRRHQGCGLGSRLLAEALRHAVAVSDAAAARLVVVDAIDQQAAEFYRRWGFVEVEEHPPRLFRKIADIRRSLEAGRPVPRASE